MTDDSSNNELNIGIISFFQHTTDINLKNQEFKSSRNTINNLWPHAEFKVEVLFVHN